MGPRPETAPTVEAPKDGRRPEGEATTVEVDDLIAALRLACEQYAPCEECGAPAAEWWHWDDSDRTEAPLLTAYCGACVGDRRADCSVAEPEDHIAAIVKVRHLIGRVHVDALAELAAQEETEER